VYSIVGRKAQQKHVYFKAKKNAKVEQVDERDNVDNYPLKKIDIVRQKLEGGHPSLVLLEELRHGRRDEEQHFAAVSGGHFLNGAII
jgi:hypothetical protein